MADAEFSGKVAIVTGAGGVGGLGETTARLLATAGAKVVLADLGGSSLDATTAALKQAGFEVASCVTDISDEAQVKALMAFAKQTFGKLDVLINNAASQGHRDDTDVMSMSVDLWDKVMSVNARGAMLMCKHAMPLMIAGGGGAIVNVSSGTSVAGDFFATAYACTKGAINTLTRYVATQGGAAGIRCNAVTPGLILTPKLAESLPPAMQEIFRQHTVTQALGQPDDIAEAIVFLASDRSRFITGQVVPVDGGFYAHVPTTVEVAALFAQAPPPG